MSIYQRTKINYRKIWEESNDQKIPKGHHIHHIDGNNSNNNPDNLLCVSPQEHYNIHKSQGDWGDCWALLRTGHLSVTPEERSEISSKTQLQRIQNGTHHFLMPVEERSKRSKKINEKRVKEGSHNFLGENNPARIAVKNGSFHLLKENGGSELAKRLTQERIQNGTHPFLGGSVQSKIGKKRAKEGTLGFQDKSKHKECPHCKKIVDQGNFSRWHGDNCKMKK